MGVSAIRYYDLRAGRKSYDLDFEQMFAFKGHTSVYLQYALARARSITRKHGPSDVADGLVWEETTDPLLAFFSGTERQLALELVRFEDAVVAAADKLAPHLLCEYLFGVAQAFHGFYAECPVGGDSVAPEVRQSRLELLGALEEVMVAGMGLVGVTPLERM